MVATLTKGQKTDVTKAYPGLTNVVVGLGWNAQSNMDLDASAFLLDANGKVMREEDFVFYGNPSAGQGSVVHSGDNRVGGGNTDNEQIQIDLSRVPASVEKIAFTITIYEGNIRKQNFGQVSNAYVRIVDQRSGTDIIRYDLGRNFSVETAIVVGELYRYKGEWKFNAIGSGFDGGLAALCGNFGVEVADTATPPAPSPTPVPVPPRNQPTPTPAPAPVPQPAPVPINLQKIELKKKGDTISLKKTKGSLGEILVNLNWNQKTTKSVGFLGFGRQEAVDLDLGCLYEMNDGDKSVIQALGEQFGSFDYFPYISLDGDDRTGSVTTGENLRINGNKVREFDRILIFAFIYEGVANWGQADGVVTIKQADNPEIVVKLDEHDSRKGMCAIAMIENVDGETFRIKRLVEYFSGHQEMDRAYGWNMRWKAGSK